MSLEEDNELRDLVVKSLESNGIIGKLKAQLRASIFIALEEENSIKDKIPYRNSKLRKFLENKHGKLLFSLIKEFLEFFDLDYTKSVFEAEACLNDFLTSIDHSEITKELNIDLVDNTDPLLYNLLFHKNNGNQTVNTENRLNEQLSTETESITPKPITQIRTSIKSINNKTFTKLDNVSVEISRESSVVSDHETTSEKGSVAEDYSSVDQNSNNDDNFLIDFDKSLKLPSNIETTADGCTSQEIQLNLLDETISNVICSSPLERIDRIEKVKPFSSLSSLQDLPPLNLNTGKNRNEPILLPSLYSREAGDNKKDRKYSSDSQSCDESIDMDNIKSHSS